MAKALHTPLVRFGGNFTSGYHWQDGIGPSDNRISMLNTAWGIPEYNTFGTDEFLQFCKLIGATPQIALNLGSGTPQEAADWVKYVDDHFNGGNGGLHWELGNELWGTWNMGWPTLSEIPGRTLAFSQAVKQVDPNAILIATGHDPATVIGNGMRRSSPLRPVLSICSPRISFCLPTACCPTRLRISLPRPCSPCRWSWAASCKPCRPRSTKCPPMRVKLIWRLRNGSLWPAQQRSGFLQYGRCHRSRWRLQHADAQCRHRSHCRHDWAHGNGRHLGKTQSGLWIAHILRASHVRDFQRFPTGCHRYPGRQLLRA